MCEPTCSVGMTSGSAGRYEATSRTWIHIKVLYILNILLSAVVLALFVVCFMMVLEVQRGVNSEMEIRKERENLVLNTIFEPDTSKASNQRAEISTSVDENPEKLIVLGDGNLKINAATLTRFCASIHSHCPVRGPTGLPGIPGQSHKGERGAHGLPGQPGAPGLRGPVGPRGDLGVPGFGLMGPPGATGNAGPKGNKGIKGESGGVGQKGMPGETGLVGLGVKGDPGGKGQKGNAGLPGHDGVNGLTGLKGEKGEHGSPGLKGAKGDPGMANNSTLGIMRVKGEKGDSGLPGLSGQPGIIGLTGTPGLTGPPGVSGEMGQSGPPGDTGLPGTPGKIGLPGPPGSPGINGLPGSDGLPGTTGMTGEKGVRGESTQAEVPEITLEKLMQLNISQFLKGPKGDQGEVLQCECIVGPPGVKGIVGPPGVKGDPGICSSPPPISVLYRNTSIPDRKKDLTIKTIGKPLLIREMDNDWGSWMVDSDPTPTTKDKYFVTHHFTGRSIYAFDSLAKLMSRTSNYSKVYNIQDQFYGTGGAIYRGAFYYHRAGLDMIARYDLDSRTVTAQLPIGQSLHRGSESLFSTSYNYYDLAVDENGLWVIYAFKPQNTLPASPSTLLVAKLEPNYVEIEKAWNITVSRQDYANAFIAQGILYLLESGTKKNTQFSFAYDLYANNDIDLSLPFLNVFSYNKMLAYDYAKSSIMAWDADKIISYPLIAE